MAFRNYHDEGSRRFYTAVRKRRYDDALREVVPRDVYAEYVAKKVERELERRANTPPSRQLASRPVTDTVSRKGRKPAEQPESVQISLIRLLNSGQLKQAKAMVELRVALSRLRRSVNLRSAALVSEPKVEQSPLDDQKIQALREVLRCDQINDKQKTEWALVVCQSDISSSGADALNFLLKFIAGLGLTCEGSLLYLRALIKDQA